MALQRQPQWLPLFVLLLLCTIAYQSLVDQQYSSAPHYVVAGADAAVPTPSSSFIHADDQGYVQPFAEHQNNIHANSAEQVRASEYIQKRETKDKAVTGVAKPPPLSFRPTPSSHKSASPFSPSADLHNPHRNQDSVFDGEQQQGKNVRFNPLDGAPYAMNDWRGPTELVENSATFTYRGRNAGLAQTNCNSDTPQVLGTGWNGTFASNSQDGMYPSLTRSCTWTIQAAQSSPPAASASAAPSPSPSPSAGSTSPLYVVSLTFWSPLQLVCGIDYLTLYDGPDTSSPVIATLCGNIMLDSVPTLYSSGPQMTAVFSTQAGTPASYGFTAFWSSVLPCNICLWTGRGTCSANGCVCSSRYTGSVCQTETTGFKDFTPRSQHAMAYDSVKDMVYITGGTSFQYTYMWDLLTYTFSTNKWNKINLVNVRSPDPRYGHFSFMYNSELYVYGGVTMLGGMADLWKFNGKLWTLLQPYNLDQVPSGRIGSACVLITVNNATQLAVFGGMNAAGVTTRDLNIYDLTTSMWKQSDHQNSVGLSGATAVFHKATQSIYYFGGMVNQTTRNTITYQYFIPHDLWYALAPRIDPLTATPVTAYNGTISPSPLISSNDTTGDVSAAEDESQDIMSQQYLPPVMYDPVSGVWAPAALMGDDMVVMYGGMRPYGLGVYVRDPSCFVRNMVIYDLSCQNWTTYDIEDANGVIRNRVNHTMVLRPPGAAGASKTAWTAYIFGGFDGWEHQDMVNVTINVPTPAPADVNNCRALRWCNLYDDCQNCNPNYCSYVGGLCLFDTDKAKANASSTAASALPAYLLGTSNDIPKNGTVQDLIRQRPDLNSEVLPTSDYCPIRTALDLAATYSSTIQPGQEITFKTYIDAQDLDIQFQITTNPAAALDFGSQNVWEGFMNMYWRADHGLTDDSWNGSSETSAPIPMDVPTTPDNITVGDNAVITPAGVLNVSELFNRWTKYSGLDASPSSSALRQSTYSTVDFPAGDPRRFSGYYVYSIKNSNPAAISFTLQVNLLDPPENGSPSGSQFDLATLGFVMVGFILAVLLLILLGRKIRKVMQRREEQRRALAELRMLEEEEEEEREEERRRQEAAITSGGRRENLKDMKPMYRVVVGVQQRNALEASSFCHVPSTLRNRGASGRLGRQLEEESVTTSLRFAGTESAAVISGTTADSSNDKRNSPARPDFICDLGSALTSSRNNQTECTASNERQEDTDSSSSSQPRWSLKSLGRSSSLKRFGSMSRANSEDQCVLPSNRNDIVTEKEGPAVGSDFGSGVGSSAIPGGVMEGEQQVVDLDIVANIHSFERENTGPLFLQRSRNPVRVQPISIEPLAFHGGLVPRTRRHYQRYQRSMSRRQQQQQGSRTTTPVLARSASWRSSASKSPSGSVSKSLSQARRTASRMTLKSCGHSAADVPMSVGESVEGIEMDPLGKPGPQREGSTELKYPRPIRMRGRQEYEPGPLVAVNVLVVFPGDSRTRPVVGASVAARDSTFGGSDAVEEAVAPEDQRLPPMAIGSVFVPDPVRWWAYRAKQQQDRRMFEHEMKRRRFHQERFPEKSL